LPFAASRIESPAFSMLRLAALPASSTCRPLFSAGAFLMARGERDQSEKYE